MPESVKVVHTVRAELPDGRLFVVELTEQGVYRGTSCSGDVKAMELPGQFWDALVSLAFRIGRTGAA